MAGAVAYRRVPARVQPQGGGAILWSNPITRGIAFVARCSEPGSPVFRPDLRRSTVTGTKVRPSPAGLARGFGSTLGAGTSDNVVVPYSAHSTQRTYLIGAMINGGGGSSLGRIIDKLSGSANAENINLDFIGGKLNYNRYAATANGTWAIAKPASGVWFWLLISFDSSSTSNVPAIWLNGVRQTVSTTSSPSGAWVNNTDNYNIGNRASDGARNWDGLIGDVVAWDRILTDDEAVSILANPNQIYAANQPIFAAWPDSTTLPTISAASVTNILTDRATPVVALTY